DPPRAVDRPPALETRGLSKRFGDIQANDGIDLQLRAGEIHAILGENGAGKSVLAKTLYGVGRPDGGTILRDGDEVVVDSPAKARALGIGLVFQDFRLIPALSVLENVLLSLPTGGMRLQRRVVTTQIGHAAERYGLKIRPRARIRDLSMGERQQVEILKLLLSGARVMILDEPTSLLAPQEVDALGRVLRELREEGLALALITHKLVDVRAMCDRVTVLRGGVVQVRGLDPAGLDDAKLVEAVVGRHLPQIRTHPRQPAPDATPALQAVGIDVEAEKGRLALSGVSLMVARGEIVGVAGVSGSGQRELADVALGLRRIRAGTLAVLGHDVSDGRPAKVLGAGAAGVSEDPLATDVVRGLTVTEHMALSRLVLRRRGLGYDWRALERQVAELPETHILKIADGARLVSTLSGGNVQRVMLCRAFAREPGFIVAAYPTRGLDLANVMAAQELLLRHARAGAGVLLMSEDLDELFLLSDRIVVLHAGRVVASVDPDATERRDVGSLMLGLAA
ncbi:MAG: ral nucleoside transport system ATP-binding protein, partial [Solirubrobacteraceae bacterium]|nr:ral nucleoside transport system ATP-binding protein [Solirubrobacteraceae bacterium]